MQIQPVLNMLIWNTIQSENIFHEFVKEKKVMGREKFSIKHAPDRIALASYLRCEHKNSVYLSYLVMGSEL
jgi:hypothetical protein